ncbi:bifunctional diaminohydroxyphosphoribosylaminopyrimidine deaminase/5-amino-6-(5-phosphoribosylamino)uracil reductase RibD [Streptomyces spiramenti]|uniref:Riboflavin biosynthesis protein RibD n=1 Tax=Streptomyces spiramenti TaxID=2720606 RepID=A0ABX1AU23_9ACTN|nr:bifunctional diaminohydroxyphosphoribosylaminopyrimidine deaminase/5-amino-6-(5-phosphoribosylamino)uracil reductase RibD [Streptomyces spiramenti]NJP67782.1 bifunctional diaminohydroxyphosphoribosylaminopyrimidine deaminase/5-amino-6-(5-phosphoribosylamino)uracil reductase RibD [Streptomyces spiramenti]
MRRALELASRGLGHTSPNPVVGCVVLAPDGRTVGEGWHRRAGGPHAEVEALSLAGDRARGGTAVVTLEPCDHTGRTGPCSGALLAAGVARVVYAVPDPTARAAGGAATLRRAGIDVTGGLLGPEAENVNHAWLTAARRGRPAVTWKYGATLDGRVAAADGSSRWITSAESRAEVHRLRHEADAVLVGSGTLRADDPHLAVRGVADAVQPLRVAVDTEAAAVRPGARVLDDAARTLVAVAADLPAGRTAAIEGSADVVRLPRAADGRGLDPGAILAELHRRGVRSVLLEGGPTLAGALLAAGLVDRVVGYLAPALLGAGAPLLNDAGVATVSAAVRLEITDVARVGPDLRVTAVPRPAGTPTTEGP